MADYDFDEAEYEKALFSGAFKRPAPAPVAAIPEEPSAWRRAPDVGVTALKGAVGLAETGIGLADIPTGGAIGRGLEKVGVRPREAQEILSSWYSPQQQAAQRAVSGAFEEGFLPGISAAIRHPSTIATTAGESIPTMLGGAGVARGILKYAPKVAPWAAGAIGEGVVGAGAAAEQIRQQSETGYLAPKQILSAVGSGAGTAAFGAVGGKFAQKFGVGDVETALARGTVGKSDKGFVRRLVESGFSEGVIEELPQSVQEQMWQNYALDRPLTEGLAESAGMGMLAGVGMGAVVGALTPRRDLIKPAVEQEQEVPPPPPGAPAPRTLIDESMYKDLRSKGADHETALFASRNDEYGIKMREVLDLDVGQIPPVPPAPSAAPPKKVSAKQRLEDLWAQSAPEDTPDFPAVSELNDDLAKTARRAAVMLEKSPKEGVAGQKALAEFTKTRDTIYAAHKNEVALKPAQEAFFAEGGSKGRWAQLKKIPVEELPTKLLDLAGDTASKAATPGSAYLAAYAAHQGITIEEAQNAIQERSAAQEVPRVGAAGQVVVEGGEGVRPGVEGQEVAIPSEAKEVALTTNVLDTFSTTLPKGQKAVFDLVRQAAENNELDKFVSPEGVWQATAIGKAIGGSKQLVYESVKALRAKLDSAAGMNVKAALAARTAAVRSTEMSDVERLGLPPVEQAQGLEMADVYGVEGAEPSMGVIETVGGSQSAIAADVSGPLTAKERAVEQEARRIIREGGVAEALPSAETLETVIAANQEQKIRDIKEADRSGDLVDAVYEWNQQVDRVPGVTAIPTDFASMELDANGVDLLHAVVSAYQDVQLQIEAALDAGTQFSDPTGAYEYEFNRIVRERTAREAGAKRVVDGRPAGAQPALEAKPEIGEGAGEPGVSPKKPVKVEVKKRRVVAKPEGEKLSETAGAENPISAESLTSRLKDMFRAAPLFDKLVTIYATQAEAVSKGALSEKAGHVAGFATADGKVGLIAENIEDGQELSIFLHEVGVHLGMEKLVGKKNFEWLRERVADWAKRNDGSKESLAAKSAIRRALKSTSANKEEEVVAYMVEELVKQGVQPRAVAKGTLSEWLGKFINWSRIALLKMGLNAKVSFSGQNLVDLAYGAASLELTGKQGATITYQSKEAFEAAERHIKGDYETLSVETLPGGRVSATRVPRGVQFSEVAPSRAVAQDSPSKGVWEKAGAAFDRFFNDPMTMVKEHGLGWLSMDHLVEVAQGVNDKLSEYRDVSRKMQALSKEWVYKAAKIDSKWGKLSNVEAKQLSAVMRAATRAGFDPETSAVPDTAAEHKIKTMYAKLSPAAVKVYKAARDHYASARVARQEIAGGVLTAAHKNLIKSAEESGDEAKLQKAKDKLKDQLAKLDAKYKEVKGPYFPLMRLGKWYVVGMSKELAALEEIDNPSKADQAKISAMRKVEKHYTTSSYETKSQAEAAQKALTKKYADTRLNRAEERSHAAGVLSAAGLQDVEDYINSSFDKEVASEIRTMMAELYYESLPEHHALKREMKREGVYGEEEDMRRVFAVSTIKSAHYMSRLKYADDLKSALFAIRREGKKSSDAMQYYNEVVKRAKLSMDETSAPWADKIAAVSYLAHLGMNPAFVLTNASQVAMITAPWLAARTSVGKTTAALGSAYRVAGDLIASSYRAQGWRAELDWGTYDEDTKKWSKLKVPEGVANMLLTLLKRNLLDITIEHDLGATAELKHHVLGDALKIGNLPVHITELANRTVTAIAAYNLAINELKMGQAEAEEFASKAVSTTQLDYSALNAPRHMQRVFGSAPAARIVMQFRKYQQGMLWLIGRSIYNALKSASPKEKAEARKTLLGLFTTTGIMAGSLGMPLAGTATWALTALAAFGGDDDEPWDARTEYLNWLTEIVGKDAATAIAKGVPAWMFGIDLEKRVGLGDVASPLPFMRQGKTAQEDAANALLAAAGAPAGTVVDVWDGVSMMSEGNWMKGAEKVIPMKGIQNLVRGARYSMEGMTERDGDVILPPDAFSIADIGAKMAGFATTKESIYYEATSAIKGAQQAAMDARKKLLAEFAQARMAKESVVDTMEKIRSFNKRHPEKGVRINASSLASALKSRRLAERQRGETGLLKSKQVRPFLKEAAFAE